MTILEEIRETYDRCFSESNAARRRETKPMKEKYILNTDPLEDEPGYRHANGIVDIDYDPNFYRRKEAIKQRGQYSNFIKIPGFSWYGGYYLSNEIIPYKSWEQACKMEKTIKLYNGKTITAHTLSKEELETIPKKERKYFNGNLWYWTSSKPYQNSAHAYYVDKDGNFNFASLTTATDFGGIRLGFKNPFGKK